MNEPLNPCYPSPCGPNSQCRANNDQEICTCLPNYVGRAPNCRPECIMNHECPHNLACINQKCQNPCASASCGLNADCQVVNHLPMCTCFPGYSGDPFRSCSDQPTSKNISMIIQYLSNTQNSFLLPKQFLVAYLPPDETPCQKNPCGINAVCRESDRAGSCTCLEGYTGDPHSHCRPECTMNNECPFNKICSNMKCVDPCPGLCGHNARCDVIHHRAECSCIPGFRGNPYQGCTPVPEVQLEPVDPCQPSPCGPYSKCVNRNGAAICSCLVNYYGSPPNCRPECVVDSECSFDKNCVNMKCRDPCPGTCGINSRCQVVNHSPICSCDVGYTGDPFIRCIYEERKNSENNPISF